MVEHGQPAKHRVSVANSPRGHELHREAMASSPQGAQPTAASPRVGANPQPWTRGDFQRESRSPRNPCPQCGLPRAGARLGSWAGQWGLQGATVPGSGLTPEVQRVGSPLPAPGDPTAQGSAPPAAPPPALPEPRGGSSPGGASTRGLRCRPGHEGAGNPGSSRRPRSGGVSGRAAGDVLARGAGAGRRGSGARGSPRRGRRGGRARGRRAGRGRGEAAPAAARQP